MDTVVIRPLSFQVQIVQTVPSTVGAGLAGRTSFDCSRGEMGGDAWRTMVGVRMNAEWGGVKKGKVVVGGGGHRGWSPHHSLGNKPAVYWLLHGAIIPFYPQLNQQQKTP